MKNYNPISLLNLDQTTHGMCGTRTWKSWTAMMRRCRGNNEKAKWYYAKGIRVCERWHSFENFYADMGDRPANTSLDRIDGTKGYEPGNCRWATHAQQCRNKSDNVVIEFNGKRQCVAEWSREIGIQRQTIHKRLKLGWPVDRVLAARMFHENKGRRKVA